MYKYLLFFCSYTCYGHDNTTYKAITKNQLEQYRNNKNKQITFDYIKTNNKIEGKESAKPIEKESHILPEVYSKRATLKIVSGESLLNQLYAFAAEHDICINTLSSIIDITSLNYQFHDKPILEILEMLCQIMEWRLTIDNVNVTVSKDKPYVFLHTFNALNTKGKSFTKTAASTTDSGVVSTSALVYSDVWREVEQYLMFLTDANMNAEKMKQKDANHDHEEEKLITSLASAPHTTGKTNSYQALAPRYEEDRYKTNDKSIEQDKKGYYIINQHAGIITLYATQAQHKAFAKYLHRIEEKLNLQVRFEGKIFSLASSDTYKFGFDINKFIGLPIGQYINAIKTGEYSDLVHDSHVNTGHANNNNGNNNSNNSNNDNASSKSSNYNITFADIFSMLAQFGTVHTLSNPQITIANNEIGVFKYTTNKIYKRCEIEENTDQMLESQGKGNAKRPRYFISKTTKEHIEKIPVGFTLCIQPSIDPNTGIVYAHVVQRIISVDDTVQSDNSSNQYPVVSQKEIDTKIRINPNEWIALGGYVTKQKNKEKGFGFGIKWNSDTDIEEILLVMKGTTIYTQVVSLRSRKIQLYSNRS